MAMDAAALAHKVHDLVTQELRLAPASGQRLPSPEDIRKILRGPLPGIFSFLVNNAVSTSKARDVRSNIRIAAASRQNSLGTVDASSGDVARHGQLMQEAAALRVQLNEVQAESAGFCRQIAQAQSEERALIEGLGLSGKREALLNGLQSHYDSELDVLDEYLARVERSIIVSDSRSGGSGSSNAFESHLDRTTAALSNSLSQVLVSVPHGTEDDPFESWFDTHRRAAASAWPSQALANAADLVSSANFSIRSLQPPPEVPSNDPPLQRVQDLIFRMHLSHAALFNAAQRCQQAAGEQQQRLAAIVAQLPQLVTPSVASSLQNARRLAATSATHSELLQFCRERSAATSGAAALRQDVERLRALCDQTLRRLSDGNAAGRKLSTLASTYSQFLPAQQRIVHQYATSILLQQGEALLNDVVSTSGIFSRASDFVATLPISDPCHPTITLPSDIAAAASVPFFLAPEAAVARVASSRTRSALALSNSALSASVSRSIRSDPRWNDAVSDASLAVLKQRCATAVSEILPLLQPLRSAVAEAQEARSQVAEVGTLVRQLSEQAAAHVCTWETVDGLNFRQTLDKAARLAEKIH